MILRLRQRTGSPADTPDPNHWRDEELVILAETASLFFENGLFTVGSLRSAIAKGELAATMVCNRLYTSPLEIRRMIAIHPGEDRGVASL